MTAYILTEQEHTQITEHYERLYAEIDLSEWDGKAAQLLRDTLAMLKAMKPAKPKGWVTQAGTVTGAIAGDGSAHDGELYGWKPLYAKEQQ